MLREQLGRVLHAIRHGDSRDAERLLLEMLRADEKRRAERAERDRREQMLADCMARHGITRRAARALLALEHPDMRWNQR